MKRGFCKGYRAMTLVEMVVILSVIAILTAVLVPTVLSHIAQSRVLRARQDVMAIAGAINRFYDDTGFVPRTTDSVNGVGGANVVDMLVSPGEVPALPQEDAGSQERWVRGSTDFLRNHLVNNVPGYRLKRAGGGPGWNGPYFSAAPSEDPWGNRYMVNVVFLEPGGGAVSEDGQPKRAVFVLSAGPDGIIQTPFEQPVTHAEVLGDDIAFRLQ